MFLAALAIFETGSVMCGAAPSSTALIVGRAVAGVGAAGLLIGSTTASAQVAPLRLRPTIMGIMGSLFAICNVLSPLVSAPPVKLALWQNILTWPAWRRFRPGSDMEVVRSFLLKYARRYRVQLTLRTQVLLYKP